MSYFKFLEEASSDEMCSLFREESKQNVAKFPDLIAEYDEGEEPDGEEEVKSKKTKKSKTRSYSKTLKVLVLEYDPESDCDGSDVTCLLDFHFNNEEICIQRPRAV